MTYRHLDTKEVAARIRKELKAAFKGQKFSVTMSRYSMGSSVSISWTDGPNVAQVERISKKYDFRAHDSHTDYHYAADARMIDGELVQASCYISHSRDLTEAPCREILADIQRHYAGAENLTVEPTYRGHFWINTNSLNNFEPLYCAIRDARAEWTAYPDAPAGLDEETAAQVQAQREEREKAERLTEWKISQTQKARQAERGGQMVETYQHATKTAAHLMTAEKIVIEWSESPEFEDGQTFTGPTMWADYNAAAARAVDMQREHMRLGYDKTKVHIHYPDGEVYTTRHDIDAGTPTLEADVLSMVSFYGGAYQPEHMTAEVYAEYVAEHADAQQEARAFIAKYRIGDAPTQPRAEKPRVRLNLDGTFTRLDQPAAPANIPFVPAEVAAPSVPEQLPPISAAELHEVAQGFRAELIARGEDAACVDRAISEMTARANLTDTAPVWIDADTVPENPRVLN